MNGTISKANVAINQFCIHLFNCSALALNCLSKDLFLERAITFTGRKRVSAGWAKREGQQRSGPGLECSIEVWCFDGKLCECWGQTAATVAARGAWDRNQAGREKKAVKRTVMNGPERAALPANSTEESP